MSAEGGNRTRTPLRAGDFESPASTYFTTSAASMNLVNSVLISTILRTYSGQGHRLWRGRQALTRIRELMSTILQMRYQDHF